MGNAEKHHIMINISPNCNGTFPERISRKTRFSEMTQQHRGNQYNLYRKKRNGHFFFLQELPLDNHKHIQARAIHVCQERKFGKSKLRFNE